MNRYLLSVVEQTLERATEKLACLTMMQDAFNYDEREHIQQTFQSVQMLYYTFFLKAGFLKEGIEYCIDRFARFIRHTDPDEFPNLKELIDELKGTDITGFDDRYKVFPVHKRISGDRSYTLLSGLAAVEKGKKSLILVGKELRVEKNKLESIPREVEYLKNLLNTYDSRKYKNLREYAYFRSCSYKKMQQDCRYLFKDTFYQHHLKMRLISVLEDILFGGMNLREIALANNFGSYTSMYTHLASFDIVPGQIPRFGFPLPN